ncbi:hypothetical protein DVV91_10590 [Clostridium botulinum]|uniref:hypothetical protein n=1 Tax=Clostridium botulinum TaxID=1491 RepID=UPI0007742B2D|nr:hypothetical protein [Clostridium botulinum]MBN1074789.1 hypothetical protein [Clostridium botulinum]NFH69031.1 hypothetical protein [Clostridium botulinum]NFL87391.1 hypothetical protein [Clostridium botulinum]NFO21728.1 hypothetical protein [Clostridium botulinum]NFP00028.1 hypothetical protein [Clostridium botulinum]
MSFKYGQIKQVTITSESSKLPKQKHRSSLNYDLSGIAGTNILWICPAGIIFDVKQDRTAAKDPILFSNVANGRVTTGLSKEAAANLYIADPQYATLKFDIILIATTDLPTCNCNCNDDYSEYAYTGSEYVYTGDEDD